jgi:flagellar M-ring protein FliF
MAFFRQVRDWWIGLSRKVRIGLLVALAGVLLISLVTAIILNHKNYVLLYNGASTQESASVLVTLGEMNIEPRITDAGAIYVPDDDLNQIRMRLAQNGFEGNTFNYDVFNSASLTSTQSDRDTYYLFQTQDRLQQTIELFDEVETAVVTLNAPQPSIYALNNDTVEPSASVTVRLYQGEKLTPEQIQTILNLVKPAVAGLEEENISITDTISDLKLQLESYSGSNVAKINLTEEVNRNVRNRILGLLQPLYGQDNVQVAVNSVLDIDQKTTQTTQYNPINPEDPTNNPLDYAEYDREKLGGEAGPVEGVAGANDNVDTPQYAAEDVDVTDADSFVVQDVLDYLVSSVREEIVKEGLEITDMSVAVLINANTLPADQRDQIIDSVAKASGVPAENISVQNIPFAGLTPYEAPTIAEDDTTRLLIITGIALLALCIIFVSIIMVMRKRQKEREAALAAEGDLYDENGIPLVDLMAQEEDFEPIAIPETTEAKLKSQIRDLATSDPEIVAQLIKTWLIA